MPEIPALEELTNIVNSKEKPFQVFVKTIDERTITINDVTSQSTILSIMKKIEAKEGLSVDIQRLQYAGKELKRDLIAADYNIQKEATLFSLLRLHGGRGEKAAMEYLLTKDLYRGNVKDDIINTAAESLVLTDWGRELIEDEDFITNILTNVSEYIKSNSKLNLNNDGQVLRWWKKNYTHLSALIQEATHSGNCGDFALTTQSKLLTSTSDQFVSILTMCGPRPDKEQSDDWKKATKNEKIAWLNEDEATQKEINKTRKKAGKAKLSPKMYDHQLCVTYYNQTENLEHMDLDRAMIADGWGGNTVSSLRKFVDGLNAYNEKILPQRCGLPYPNLQLSGCQKADKNGGMDAELKQIIKKDIEERLAAYKASTDFKDTKSAYLKATKKNELGRIFQMNPRNEVKYEVDQENVITKLNKMSLPQEASLFKQECLDLSSKELALYFFSTKSKKYHRKSILIDPELKIHLQQFLLSKELVSDLPPSISKRLKYFLPTPITPLTSINLELLELLRIKGNITFGAV